jgi:hypothetical protein
VAAVLRLADAGAGDVSEHRLKCWPEPFAALRDGSKAFEFRRDDRGFAVGDLLVLREWRPQRERLAGGTPYEPGFAPDLGPGKFGRSPPGEYTGRFERRRVTYIARGPDWGIPAGFVVMSLGEEASVSFIMERVREIFGEGRMTWLRTPCTTFDHWRPIDVIELPHWRPRILAYLDFLLREREPSACDRNPVVGRITAVHADSFEVTLGINQPAISACECVHAGIQFTARADCSKGPSCPCRCHPENRPLTECQKQLRGAAADLERSARLIAMCPCCSQDAEDGGEGCACPEWCPNA